MNSLKANICKLLWIVGWLGIVSTPSVFAGVVAPKITVQPQNQSVLHGDSATFSVAATGTQPLSYQWKYNGLSILGATGTNLVLQGVSSLLLGNYKVTVSNSAGSATSSNAALSIDVPPSILVPPLGLSLLAGNSGTLSVVATGSQPLSYQWYCNGIVVTGATNASLVLSNVQTTSSGSYVVTVSNPLGSVSSSPIIVAIHVPALITLQPLSLAAILGNNFSLSTVAIGDSPLSYQWFFNNHAIAGATNSILNITNALSSQAGNYTVTVNNPFGTDSSAIAQVTLSIPAAISQQPVEQDVIAGGNAIFSVQGTGTPPLSYQWRLNGSPVLSATNATWVLTNVTAQMSGDVSVVISNLVGGDTSMTVPLNVTRTVRQGMVDSYNGSANNADFAQAVKVDLEGNAYVTGYARENGEDLDYITIKYDTTGHRVWRSAYNGNASKDDQAEALAVDGAGNVYVTGSSEGNGTGLDIATVKYDANGNQLWVARYNSPAGRDEQAHAIAVDSQGNVYVTGSSQGNSSGLDYVTIKYDTNGNQLWVARYNGPGNVDDAAQALALDPAGNVFVTGYSVGNGSGNDYATIKYDTNGNQLWVARYNGPANLEDDATQIAVTPDGGVCVTGQSKGSGTDFDYATVKYAGNGNQIWVRRFNGSGSKADQAKDLAIDALGNVLVTGSSTGQAGSLDYVTIKYDPQGTLLWQSSYDAGDVDQANAIALDLEGNAYVTGSSKGNSGGADFATVKYDKDNGDQLWVARYNGPANNDDNARSIAVDAQHRIYVTGESKGSTDFDFVTIQYVQPEPPVITLQPSSQSVNIGGSVTFLVVATGSDPLSYQWRLNGVNIPAATNNILILTNAQTTDSGAYDVVVANDADSVKSDTVNLTVNGAPIALGDNFADRIVVNSLLGIGVGSNIGATRESGEPRPAGKSGGKSVWFTWRAPASGIVTITTRGSTFDTLLGVYTGTNVTSLTPIASDDDSGGFLTSSVTFNAQVGTDYQIQVDGVNGASGLIVVSWNLEITSDRIPVVTSLSGGQTVGVGEQVTFAVSVDLLGVGFQWYHDGVLIPGAVLSSLQVTNIQSEDVGLYYVRLIVANREVPSKPTYLQINRTDDTVDRSAVAVDKFSDLPILSSTKTVLLKSSSKTMIKMGTTSRGYSTTQIFTTYSGTTQPGEPSNCGVPGGASAWYSYTAQRDGTLYINTDGSSFDTTLGVYTGNGNDFSSLTVVACDDDSGANGKTSAVRFQAYAGTNYFISVDGKNGASGRVVLNINLGDPAAIAAAPQSSITTNGQNAIFAVSANGSAPFAYEWKFNGVKISNATNSSLVISNVQNTKVGQYSVTVSNLINKIAAQPASLMLASPTLSIIAQPANQTVSEGQGIQFSVTASSTSTIRYQWRYNGSDIPAATNSSLTFSQVQAGQAGIYSALLSDTNGVLQSASASLVVSPNVVIVRQPGSTTVGANSNVTLSVVAYGSPAINYQWKFNGVNLPGATNANLTLANFNAGNEGTYRVVVSNFTNLVTSSDALLMVGSTPRLLAPSQSINGTFQFQAAALANVNYSIQASTNLIQWVTITQVSSTNGYISFSDAQASQTPARYYRLVSGP